MTSYLGFDIDADEARFLTPIEGTGKTDGSDGTDGTFPIPTHSLSLFGTEEK